MHRHNCPVQKYLSYKLLHYIEVMLIHLGNWTTFQVLGYCNIPEG